MHFLQVLKIQLTTEMSPYSCAEDKTSNPWSVNQIRLAIVQGAFGLLPTMIPMLCCARAPGSPPGRVILWESRRHRKADEAAVVARRIQSVYNCRSCHVLQHYAVHWGRTGLTFDHLNVSLSSSGQEADVPAELHRPHEIFFIASSPRLFE